jgi:DNA-binding NarL/FixJ family response regulator
MTRTRIFIVHENSSLASQAASILNNEAHLHVMDLMTSTHEALAYIGHGNCDFVLVSASLAKNGALQLIKCLRQQATKVKVIVTGLQDDQKQILAYIAAGAVGYILKKEGLHAWANHIYAVHHGKPLVSPTVTAAMMMHLNTLSQLTTRFEPKAALYANLTNRECEILELLATGNSNESIAERLLIGLGTVKNHVHNILKKLKLRSRRDASSYLSLVQRRVHMAPAAYAH